MSSVSYICLSLLGADMGQKTLNVKVEFCRMTPREIIVIHLDSLKKEEENITLWLLLQPVFVLSDTTLAHWVQAPPGA